MRRHEPAGDLPHTEDIRHPIRAHADHVRRAGEHPSGTQRDLGSVHRDVSALRRMSRRQSGRCERFLEAVRAADEKTDVIGPPMRREIGDRLVSNGDTILIDEILWSVMAEVDVAGYLEGSGSVAGPGQARSEEAKGPWMGGLGEERARNGIALAEQRKSFAYFSGSTMRLAWRYEGARPEV